MRMVNSARTPEWWQSPAVPVMRRLGYVTLVKFSRSAIVSCACSVLVSQSVIYRLIHEQGSTNLLHVLLLSPFAIGGPARDQLRIRLDSDGHRMPIRNSFGTSIYRSWGGVSGLGKSMAEN